MCCSSCLPILLINFIFTPAIHLNLTKTKVAPNMIIIPTDKTKSDTNSFRIFALIPMNKFNEQQTKLIYHAC